MTDVGQYIRKGTETFSQLQAAYAANDLHKCDDLLRALKKIVIHFPTYLSPDAAAQPGSATRVQEIMLVREVLEHAILIAIKKKDTDAVASSYAQLRVYYKDMDSSEKGEKPVPKSERELLLIGLNLTNLLVCSRVSEFHAELEQIPRKEHSNMFIKFPIALERYLMEGSYNMVLHSRSRVPSNDYLPFVEMIEATVRAEIAACISVSYPTLSAAAAKRMLMLSSDDELDELAKKLQWSRQGNTFVFSGTSASDDKKDIQFSQVLGEYVHYAADLQRVV